MMPGDENAYKAFIGYGSSGEQMADELHKAMLNKELRRKYFEALLGDAELSEAGIYPPGGGGFGAGGMGGAPRPYPFREGGGLFDFLRQAGIGLGGALAQARGQR